jgi:hypothetical protein
LSTFNKAKTALNPSCGLTDAEGDDDTFSDKLTVELSEYGSGTGSGDDFGSGDDSNGAGAGFGSCSYDADAAPSWLGSGAADLLDVYIGSHGTDMLLSS